MNWDALCLEAFIFLVPRVMCQNRTGAVESDVLGCAVSGAVPLSRRPAAARQQVLGRARGRAALQAHRRGVRDAL